MPEVSGRLAVRTETHHFEPANVLFDERCLMGVAKYLFRIIADGRLYRRRDLFRDLDHACGRGSFLTCSAKVL